MINPSDFADRHASVQDIVPFFDTEHLPAHLAQVSRIFEGTVQDLLYIVSDHPELTVALRKLLEAKDAAVRAQVMNSS